MNRTIRTNFVYPPIPVRDFDWEATEAGYEPGDLIGRGPTEQAAIEALLDQLNEELVV